MLLADIATIIATIGGIGLIIGLVHAARVGNGDREAEQAARDFYAAHGHWPDEAPPEVDGLPAQAARIEPTT
jgi:hypothetical protein